MRSNAILVILNPTKKQRPKFFRCTFNPVLEEASYMYYVEIVKNSRLVAAMNLATRRRPSSDGKKN